MARRFVTLALVLVLMFTMAAGALADYPELIRGSRDSGDSWAVYSLQMKLIELGYMSGSADGVYGGATETAVKTFQSENGLEATGVADSVTQEKIYATVPQAAPTPEPGSTAAPGTAATEEPTSEVDTMILQSYLFAWGFTTEAPDGKMGVKTRQALTEFQKYAYDDMVSYMESVRAAATPEPTPEPTPTPLPGEMAEVVDMPIDPVPTIAADGNITPEWFDYIENAFDWRIAEVGMDDKSQDVMRVQRRLMALDYLPAGSDGYFGTHTEVALKYFQYLNGLDETGVMDAATQEKFFSNNVVSSDKFVTMYKAMVSVKDQRVYIYQWTGTDYTALVHTFVCSTGAPSTPTIVGTYQAPGRNGEWYFMEDSNCWVQYAFVIDGGYFFHSVLFNQKGGKPTSTSVRNLGKAVSHGCIRLAVEDVKWIYENCSNGMTVTIYED
jgi:peptidoglycan hydrolase-like protein with peptidoglycan-binding domain